MNALRILMAVCRLPAVMALCAAASLAVSAFPTPALSMQPAVSCWPTTVDTALGLATTVTVAHIGCDRLPAVPTMVRVKVFGVTNGQTVSPLYEVSHMPARNSSTLRTSATHTPLQN